MKINRSKIFQWIKVILPILLMLFAIHELTKIVREANGAQIARQLGSIDVRTLALIAVVPLFLAFPMFFYDFFIMKKLKLKMPIKRLMKESLIINSFSNLIGFGGLVGVLLRTHYFKKPDMDNTTFFKMIASVTLFYLGGISLFADLLLIFFRDIRIFTEHPFLLYVAAFIGLYTPFLIVRAIVQLLRKKMTKHQLLGDVALIFVSICEWLGAFTMLVILTKLLHIDVTLIDLWPMFVIASAAGIVSMIPGGLGSFDLVFIWGATSLNIPSESVLVLLLFYRVGYYAIPFLAGLVLFIRDIWRTFNRGYNSIPNLLLERTMHIIATALVFLAGLSLLISSVAPGAIEKIKYVRELTSLPFINVSHQVSVMTGFLLLALSNGISYKDRRTFKVTLFVLLFAATLFIVKGIQYRQALFMIFVALLLYFARNRFYRTSYVETWGRSIFNTFVITVVLLSYLVIGIIVKSDLRHHLSEHVQGIIIRNPDDLFKSALIGLIVIGAVVLFERWQRNRTQFKRVYLVENQDEVAKHIAKYGVTEAHHFEQHMHQCIFWNKQRNVLFSYRITADKFIVQGDLIGDQKHFKSSIEEFITFADYYGYTPVFYEVSDSFIPYLYGYGYNFFKLGEEGNVEISEVVLTHEEKEQCKKLQKEMQEVGYTFEWLEPKFSESFIRELAELSAIWQGDKEQIGEHYVFNERYLNNGPIVLLRNKQQEIVAFANLTELDGPKHTIAISLLRSTQTDMPAHALDYLLVCSLIATKEKGYRYINIGMVYLKHVGVSKYAGISEKIAAQILVNAQESGNKKDLRYLKEQYANEWRPKYIAYRKRRSLPFTMLQILMLIGDNKIASKRNQLIAMRNLKKKQRN